MWDFEVRVGNSLDNEGNDNARCSPLYTLLPGQIGTLVCKNGTLGRYVNIRVDRDDVQLSLCEVAVIGVGKMLISTYPVTEWRYVMYRAITYKLFYFIYSRDSCKVGS